MAFHHLALATTDLAATHRFYTDAMGFTLVHVEDAATDVPDGWLHHVFYDTGDGTCMAFMELHDERCTHFDPAISRGLGLPAWVNHIAFAVDDLKALDTALTRWLAHGHDVVKMRHNHGTSIYTEDPNGMLLEFTVDVPNAADIAADRSGDAHETLKRWLAGDHTSNNTYR